MKKELKIILGIIGGIILLFIVDLICIFTFNRPLLAIKQDNGDSINVVYRGLLYDTYLCREYSVPQIKQKGAKFTCAYIKFIDEEPINNEKHQFNAKVVEVYDNYIIVEPNEDEEERNSADKFYIDRNNVNYKEGQILSITYVGKINESYPAQIEVTNISIVKSNY